MDNSPIRLQQLMNKGDYTNKEIAYFLNRHPSVISRWRTGKTNIPEGVIECLEKAHQNHEIPTRKVNQKGDYIKGRWHTISDMARRFNLDKRTISFRYEQGMRGFDLIRPKQKNRTFWVNGEYLTIKQIAKKYEIKENTVKKRVMLGWRGKNLIREENYKQKGVRINGKKFSSLRQFAYYYDLDPSLVSRKIRQGYSSSDILREAKLR